jgi:hypothetical protein
MTIEDQEDAKALAKETSMNSDTLRILLEAYGTMAYSVMPHLPLELAIVDICENPEKSA